MLCYIFHTPPIEDTLHLNNNKDALDLDMTMFTTHLKHTYMLPYKYDFLYPFSKIQRFMGYCPHTMYLGFEMPSRIATQIWSI